MDVSLGIDMRLWGPATGVAQLPVFERLSALGYDGVEVPLANQGDSTLKLVAVALADLSLVPLANTRLSADANPISPDPAVRRNGVTQLKHRIDQASLLGAGLLSGNLYQAQGVLSGLPATDREWEWSRLCLREAAEHAAAQGVQLALEFQSRYDAHLINTAAGAARMCFDVGTDNIGVTYNTFHALLEEFNPARALPSAGEHLRHVHLSESNRGELGRGQVPWMETYATLDFLDYRGWLVVDALAVAEGGDVDGLRVWRNQFDSREQLAADAIALVRQVLRLQRQ